MLETVAGFDWDAGNLEKCQNHGVSVADIEGRFARPYTIRVDVEHSLAEERLRAMGKTNTGRYVFLVFTIRERNGERLIRPISARYMHGKEVDHYEGENSGLRER
jgi:uncharacterized DUF497 family protein